MATSDSKWLRKATVIERMFEIGHQLHVYLTHYTLDIATAKPLDEEFLRKALTHLYRKVPVLRVCLRERDSELWLHEMDRCNIDLKIIEEGLLEEEKDKITTYTYNSKDGPLWCVRVMPQSLQKNSQTLEETSEGYLYKYAIIFGIHHSIADGTTNVKICDLLCNIMNELLSGLTVADEEQLGVMTGDAEIQKLYDEEISRLKQSPELCASIRKELDEGSRVRPLIRHTCKIPSDVPIMTKSVIALIDADASDKFYKKAKSRGVSLHAALTTLINLSFVKLLQEHGIIQDEYNIRAGHDISIRRYCSSVNPKRALGLLVPMFGYRSPFLVPKDCLPVFWETAKAFNEKFHSDISSRKVLTISAYRIMNENIDQNFKEMFKSDGEPNYYYTVSNMGNLSGSLYEGSEHITLEKLTRFSSLRNGSSFMGIYIHTFRNQLNLTFAYSTRFLTQEFVQRLKELFEIYMPLVS